MSFHSRSKEGVLEYLTSKEEIHFLLTFLELFQALEGNFESVRVGEGGRVVEDFHPEKGDDGHCDKICVCT